MGKRSLCGQKAGLFRKLHKECPTKALRGKEEMVSLVAQSVLASIDPPSLKAKLQEIAQRSFLGGCDPKSFLVQGWEKAVNRALEDNLLTVNEEQALMKSAQSLFLTQEDLNEKNAFSHVVKAAVIRDILEGKLPKRMRFNKNLPINLQKEENIVWAFPDTTLYEQRTHTHYQGSHQGVSIRIAKGPYYRTGVFKGYPVRTATMVNMGKRFLGYHGQTHLLRGTREIISHQIR